MPSAVAVLVVTDKVRKMLKTNNPHIPVVMALLSFVAILSFPLLLITACPWSGERKCSGRSWSGNKAEIGDNRKKLALLVVTVHR